MNGIEGKAQAIEMLQSMQNALRDSGIDRLPQRGDFTAEQIVQIKAHLGPFPRALEAAGLKVPRDAAAYAERKLQKRIAAKRRKTAAKIANQESAPEKK